jgi:hypothetical protein
VQSLLNASQQYFHARIRRTAETSQSRFPATGESNPQLKHSLSVGKLRGFPGFVAGQLKSNPRLAEGGTRCTGAQDFAHLPASRTCRTCEVCHPQSRRDSSSLPSMPAPPAHSLGRPATGNLFPGKLPAPLRAGLRVASCTPRHRIVWRRRIPLAAMALNLYAKAFEPASHDAKQGSLPK